MGKGEAAASHDASAAIGSSLDSNQMCLTHEGRIFDRREGRGGRLHCTLVTGFLGSGKTTLLSHILHNRGDLRIATLVNEFGDTDIDSILLNSHSINSSFDLPSVSLVNGCACCSVNGSLHDGVRKIVSSKHNFDYLVIETSGLADPVKIMKDLQEMGVELDVIVTVVDVETVHKIMEMPVAVQQLVIADIVLINKCDVASLGIISDVEDLIENKTGGTKAVRCRFCKVPLDLVMGISSPYDKAAGGATKIADGILSHEAFSTPSRHPDNIKAMLSGREQYATKVGLRGNDMMLSERNYSKLASLHSSDLIFSATFHSHSPLCLAKLQNLLTKHMFHMKALLRAKGLIWLNENRHTRFVFHWSGKKRSEAVYSGQWESPPATSVVFIGLDKHELDLLLHLFESTKVVEDDRKDCFSSSKFNDEARQLVDIIGSDNRFKVQKRASQSPQEECALLDHHPSVVFGLVGSPLRGIHEADLNGAFMRFVNSRGVLFLIVATSSSEDNLLQLSLNDEHPSLEDIWNEFTTAATTIRAKLFRDVHPCRCDLKHHGH